MLAFIDKPLWELAPRALEIYRAAFDHANTTLLPFGILDNERRLTNFLAQILHESSALRVTHENLNYSSQRLTEVWPVRFPTPKSAAPYALNPRKLANKIYSNRMGNIGPDDGWRYRGRGMLQITGRDSYERIGIILHIGLADDPELAVLPEASLAVAAAIWKWRDCNKLADQNNVRAITRAINGGYIGLLDRVDWLKKVQRAYGMPDVLDA